MKQHNSTLEQKLSSTESSQSDKIEKTLIKSLLIGYVVSTNPNDKQQILRMISSVLDFNQGETDKVGLNKQHGGWLGSILGGGSGSPGNKLEIYEKEEIFSYKISFIEHTKNLRKFNIIFVYTKIKNVALEISKSKTKCFEYTGKGASK